MRMSRCCQVLNIKGDGSCFDALDIPFLLVLDDWVEEFGVGREDIQKRDFLFESFHSIPFLNEIVSMFTTMVSFAFNC